MNEFANQWPLITTMVFMFFGLMSMLGAFIAQGQRIDNLHKDFNSLHKDFNSLHREIIEMIKKLK